MTRTITMGFSTLMTACSKNRLVCQYVTLGKEPAELGADIVAMAQKDGSYEVTGETLAGQLLLSVMRNGD